MGILREVGTNEDIRHLARRDMCGLHQTPRHTRMTGPTKQVSIVSQSCIRIPESQPLNHAYELVCRILVGCKGL